MSDIVGSLRDFSQMPLEGGYVDPLIEVMHGLAEEAAGEIERLRAALSVVREICGRNNCNCPD